MQIETRTCKSDPSKKARGSTAPGCSVLTRGVVALGFVTLGFRSRRLSQNCLAFAGREAQYEALKGRAINLQQFCKLLASALGRLHRQRQQEIKRLGATPSSPQSDC